jgi:hypothetical protein
MSGRVAGVTAELATSHRLATGTGAIVPGATSVVARQGRRWPVAEGIIRDEYGNDAELVWPEPREDPKQEPSHPGAQRDEEEGLLERIWERLR